MFTFVFGSLINDVCNSRDEYNIKKEAKEDSSTVVPCIDETADWTLGHFDPCL